MLFHLRKSTAAPLGEGSFSKSLAGRAASCTLCSRATRQNDFRVLKATEVPALRFTQGKRRLFTAAFLRRVFARRDRLAKGPTFDRTKAQAPHGISPSSIATYRQFLAQVRKGVFENLNRPGLDPRRDRSLDA